MKKRVAFALAALLAAVLLLLAAADGIAAYRRGKREHAYLDLVLAEAERADVPPAMILAVIRVESDFRADAVSPAGACGLMQLMPVTFRDRGGTEDRIFDPAENVACGTAHLAALYDAFGNWRAALAAYNAGERRVREWIAASGEDFEIPYPETAAYVPAVVAAYHDYLEKYGFQYKGERK